MNQQSPHGPAPETPENTSGTWPKGSSVFDIHENTQDIQPSAPVFTNSSQPPIPPRGHQPPPSAPEYPGRQAEGYFGATPPPYNYTGNTPPPGQPPYNNYSNGFPPPQQPYTPAPLPYTPGKNKAIGALILGIVAIFFSRSGFISMACSIIGITLAMRAQKEMPQDNRKLATAGLVVSLIGLILRIFSRGLFSFLNYYWLFG